MLSSKTREVPSSRHAWNTNRHILFPSVQQQRLLTQLVWSLLTITPLVLLNAMAALKESSRNTLTFMSLNIILGPMSEKQLVSEST